MKDVASGVFGEDAGSRSFIGWKFGPLVVVINLAAGFFSRRERNVIVVIEIAAERRHPLEFPAHAFLKRFDLGDRRVRDGDERGVAIGEMNRHPVKVIADVRATGAAGFPAGTEHEVIDDQLAAAVEQIGERYLAVGTFEDVGFFNFFPRQFAALAA